MREESKGCLTFVIAVIVILLVLWGIGFLFTGGNNNGDKYDGSNKNHEDYSFSDYLKDEMSELYNNINNKLR